MQGQLIDAIHFLMMLYDQAEDSWLTVWSKRSRHIQWFRAPEALVSAAEVITKEAESNCVYIAWGLLQECPLVGRGGDSLVRSIPGLWADVDVQIPGLRESPTLPPTKDEALEALARYPLLPTAIVDSGHGLYPLWLFNEPLELWDADERREARDLLSGFQLGLQAIAFERHGWSIDQTAALSHLMRPVGSVNHKAKPVAVKLLPHRGPRYNPADFEPYRREPSVAPLAAAPTNGPRTMPWPGPARIAQWEQELASGAPAPGQRHRLLIQGGLLIYAWSRYGPDDGFDKLSLWSCRGCPARKAAERLAELRAAWKLLKLRIEQGRIVPMVVSSDPGHDSSVAVGAPASH